MIEQLVEQAQHFFAKQTLVNPSEDNRFEIVTPYQDMRGRIILYATIDGDTIRVSDGGYLTENFLKQNDPDSAFHIDMGVQELGVPGEARLEHNGEFVMECTIDKFGETIAAVAHGIVLIGTSKSAMMMMAQVFSTIIRQGGPGVLPVDGGDGGWPGGGSRYEA